MKPKRQHMQFTAKQILDGLVESSKDYCFATEMYFGRPLLTNRRIDFWRIHPTRFKIDAVEIKVSRRDFKKDTHSKQLDAIANSHKFYYATPKGLLDPHELPDWAGLMEFDGRRFTIKKQAPVNTVEVKLDWRLVINIFNRSSSFSRSTRNLTKLLNEAQYFAKKFKKESETYESKNIELLLKNADLELELNELKQKLANSQDSQNGKELNHENTGT